MNRSLVWWCGLAVTVVTLLVSSSALAQSPNEEELFEQLTAEQEARVIELIDEGEAAYDAGEFERSAELFHEVHELFPHPSISYRLGLAYERLGDAEMAIQYYQRFLELDPDASERGRVERTIEELEEELGDDRSTLRVESFPIGARIYIGDTDTAPVGETPQQVTLEPGSHRIVIEKDGYERAEETAEVVEGEHQVLQVRLVEVEDDSDSGDSGSVGTGLAWWKPVVSVALFGIGGFALYQSFSYGSLAQEREDEMESYGGDPGSPAEQNERERLNDERQAAQNMSRVMGVTGAALSVGGAVFTIWWVVDEQRSLGLRIAPRSDGIAAFVGGEF